MKVQSVSDGVNNADFIRFETKQQLCELVSIFGETILCDIQKRVKHGEPKMLKARDTMNIMLEAEQQRILSNGTQRMMELTFCSMEPIHCALVSGISGTYISQANVYHGGTWNN